MTKEEIVIELSKSLLQKDTSWIYKGLNSRICIQNYFNQMTKEDLLGIATQQRIFDNYQ